MINKLDMYLILSIKHTRHFWYSEGRKSEDKYIIFWTQIANELINYDEHLIFETMYEIGYLIYLGIYDYFDYYLSQDFINIIRKSGGLNSERLLVVPMISSDFEIDLFSFESEDYIIPKDPNNKFAISIYYYFPSEDYNTFSDLDPIILYNKLGFSNEYFPLMEWGSFKNYKDIMRNFNLMKRNFIDKGIPVIIGEVGILNDYIKRNNSIDQFLYTLFALSSELEGFLPCLWDIPLAFSNYKNFYFNKENNEWSDSKYQKIFNKISKGKFIKSFDHYYKTNLETEDSSLFGLYNIYAGTKKIIKIFINIRFKIHIENEQVIAVFSSDKDFNNRDFLLKENDGKRQYDGTTIFVIDASELELYYYVQAIDFYGEEYIIINNITVQYEEAYLCFDHISYKSDILNDINN